MQYKKVIAVSFSGGRTSAYMAWLLFNHERYCDYEKIFVFSNTGKEREETLRFVDRCDRFFGMNLTWIEPVIHKEKGVGTTFNIVDYKSANRTGKPFSDMIDKYGLPNKNFPHCTRELKEIPIQKYLQSLGIEYQLAIGYRIDENRITTKKAASHNWIFPLVDDFPTWEIQVRNFWDGMPFDLELKDYEGNCDLCWKKSRRKRQTIIKENPGIENQWNDWEQIEDYDYVFDRDGYTIPQLVEMAKKPFLKAMDKHELRKMNPVGFELELSSLEDYSIEMDAEAKCMCFA